MDNDLTPDEEALLEHYRAMLPPQGTLRAGKIWIVQWLARGDRETGAELADWANQRRSGWAKLYRCQPKQEVFDAIGGAAAHARTEGGSPILHIEAHGNERGITPERNGSSYILWEELTGPLQRLNEASGCNLLIVMAACIGNAAVQALNRGPRAPAIVVIGPTDEISPTSLFNASKELYRVVSAGDASIDTIVADMSAESGTVPFVEHRFPAIAYDVLVSDLIKSARPEEIEKRKARAMRFFTEDCDLSTAQAEEAMRQHPESFKGIPESQQIWDKMFCIDICPENKERFALDMAEIYRAAEALEGNRQNPTE